jgi:hypothetical protein
LNGVRIVTTEESLLTRQLEGSAPLTPQIDIVEGIEGFSALEVV